MRYDGAEQNVEKAGCGPLPAEGSRRRVILDAIHKGDVLSNTEALEIADTVEAALLKLDIGADPTGQTSPASKAMKVLDSLGIDSAREDRILDIGERVTEMADQFVKTRRWFENLQAKRNDEWRKAQRVQRFCFEQKASHARLHESDPSYGEYHRGAETAYDFALKQLRWTEKQPSATEPMPERPYDEPAHMVRQLYTTDDPEAWKGTPPAEGTRRALIRDTIGEYKEAHGNHPADSQLADAVEAALLEGSYHVYVDGGQTTRPSPTHDQVDAERVHNLLDGWGIRREDDDGATRSLYRRARELTERLRRTQEDLDAEQHRVTRAAGNVPAGTKEIHVVIASQPDGRPEPIFVELEDQDGAGLGDFERFPGSSPDLTNIVIPYGRDDAWVSEVAYQAARAATRPLLEDHPDYVFPSERVRDAVAGLLTDFGIPRACGDCQDGQLEDGRKEAAADDSPGGDDPDEELLGLLDDDDEVERLLGGREEARLGESRCAEERDCAFALLRWLLPVTVAKRID